MKKLLLPTITALISVTLLFSSCIHIPSFENLTTDLTEENGTIKLPEPSKADPSGDIEIPSAVPTETTTQPPEQTTAAPVVDSGIIGYTSKGYAISQKNGIYYVDGILIANKTYALPSDYNPDALLSECSSAFNQMKSDAADEGLGIWNASGFRSYSLQESLYNRYANRDGSAAADRYSARPGHSEHQSGLAIDLNEISSSFANTAEGKWVAENCWKYGFILRYMQEKEAQTGYMYEPWHIRYVGVEAAEKIYNSGLCLEEFYGITSAYGDPVIPVDGTAVSSAADAETTASTVTEEATTVYSVG